jgi:hypothetical protein
VAFDQVNVTCPADTVSGVGVKLSFETVSAVV